MWWYRERIFWFSWSAVPSFSCPPSWRGKFPASPLDTWSQPSQELPMDALLLISKWESPSDFWQWPVSTHPWNHGIAWLGKALWGHRVHLSPAVPRRPQSMSPGATFVVKSPQEWTGKPFPCRNSPNVQAEPPLAQLGAVSSHPVPCCVMWAWIPRLSFPAKLQEECFGGKTGIWTEEQHEQKALVDASKFHITETSPQTWAQKDSRGKKGQFWSDWVKIPSHRICYTVLLGKSGDKFNGNKSQI